MQPQTGIEVSGTFSLADLTRFQYFHTLRRTWPIAVIAVLALVFLVPFLGLLAVASLDPEWRTVFSNAFPFFALMLLWIVILGFMPYRNAKRQLASQNYLREPIAYIFTSETIGGAGPSIRRSIAWNVVRRIRETKSLFLLYHGPNIAVIVPKHFFKDSAAMVNWRQLVTASFSTGIEKPGLVGRFC